MNFYVISPPNENNNFNPTNLDSISDIIKIDFFQFRPKSQSIEKRKNFVKKYFQEIKQICEKKKIKLIINNDFEIAKKFDFDGIHLGQKDKKCSDARKVFGKKFCIGVSCGDSTKLSNIAKKEGASYVAFGPIFKSPSKKKKKIILEELIKKKNEISLPFTLIGGINHKNLLDLEKIRPNHIAIISSLWDFDKGPIESAKLFKKKLNLQKGKII